MTRQTYIQIHLALADAHLVNLEQETRLELASLTLARSFRFCFQKPVFRTTVRNIRSSLRLFCISRFQPNPPQVNVPWT
jgi:hypothetical protein